MARTRVDVWNATDAEGEWPDVLRAYERAIGTMRGLDPPNGPPTDPVGWGFQAAIHGRADENGNPDTSNPFWCNCQHGSWFFLPWHRMYLAAFERIIQFHLDDDQWSLPYWYSIDPDSPKKAVLPPAFLDRTMNDNNLQTEMRSQNAKSGRPFNGDIDLGQLGQALEQSLEAPRYTTPAGTSTFGGGERSDLSFDGGERGLLENVPHGLVHSLVGDDFDQFGQPVFSGWMGSFYTAGLDPIFWCHHSNMDRLWDVWLRLDDSHTNPTGDPAFFDTAFSFPAPNGETVTWKIGDVLDTESGLGYVYESYDAPSAMPAPVDQPADQPAGRERVLAAVPGKEEAMPPQVLGAADDVPLASSEPVDVTIGRGAVERDLAAEPERLYLRIEGVTGSHAAPLYGVYLNVPEGASSRDFPELRAGSFATFGLVETSRVDARHDAEGLTAVFDVTDLRDRLAEEGRWDDSQVQVSFSTEVPGAPEEDDTALGATAAPEPDLRARRVALMAE